MHVNALPVIGESLYWGNILLINEFDSGLIGESLYWGNILLINEFDSGLIGESLYWGEHSINN